MSHSTLRTIYFASQLPRAVADALNAESGRIYTQVLVEQYRIYRKKGIWLSPTAQERYNDYLNTDQPRLLPAHSIDAAQQGFHKACKTAKSNRSNGAHYPYHRKRYRTTIWKNSCIRIAGDGALLLSLARGLEPIQVALPASVQGFAPEAYTEMRLVYNKISRHYEWHLVIDDGIEVKPTADTGVAAVDLGEVHPATLSDGVEACVVSCRELRSVVQHTHKRLAKFQQAQSKHQRGSRRWRRLQAKKARFLAKQALRRRDLEHRVSRAVVDWAQEHEIGTLAIGDVRDIGNGKRLNRKSQQKISSWSHGKMADYITYKAEAAGITVVKHVNEAYTSQTCASCGNRYKPQGRVYTCPACGAVVHRDAQGATNILSRFLYGELAQISVPQHTTYRHPFDVTGKRSPGGLPASCSREREATRLELE